MSEKEFNRKKIRQLLESKTTGEDVLLTDEEGNLLAVGRANLTGTEMLSFDRGVAVTTRHSRK